MAQSAANHEVIKSIERFYLEGYSIKPSQRQVLKLHKIPKQKCKTQYNDKYWRKVLKIVYCTG